LGSSRYTSTASEHVDQLAVVRRALEGDRRAAAAARLQIERHAALPRQRVLVDERLGPAQAGLLGVGQDDHHVVAQPRSAGQRPDRLQDGGGAGAVVVGARCALHRVVMGDQEHPSGGRGAGDLRDHVAHPGQPDPARAGRQLGALHRDGVLHLGRQAEAAQGAQQVLADPVVGRAAGHVRLGGDHVHLLDRPGRAELAGRRGGAAGGRRPDRPHRRGPDRRERDQGHQGGGRPQPGTGQGSVGGLAHG
jgi:hypothetical protein